MFTYKITPKYFDKAFPKVDVFQYIESMADIVHHHIFGMYLNVNFKIDYFDQKIEIKEEELNKLQQFYQ